MEQFYNDLTSDMPGAESDPFEDFERYMSELGEPSDKPQSKFSLAGINAETANSDQLDEKYLDAVKQLEDTDELRNILQTAIKNNTLGKAPNGKQSKLEPALWLMVRTKQFKDWFGDWEYVANAYPNKKFTNLTELNQYLENLKDVELPNKAENIKAFIGTSGRKKMLSNVATRKTIENGFTAKDHYTAIANIEKLFKNAIKANERDSYDSSNSIKNIEHFTSLFILKGKPALTTFTVKNTVRDGRRIYSIELIDIKKPEGILPSAVKKRLSASSGFDTLNISKIADTVNNCSKVVDENGEPLVVHHGFYNGMRIAHRQTRSLQMGLILYLMSGRYISLRIRCRLFYRFYRLKNKS